MAFDPDAFLSEDDDFQSSESFETNSAIDEDDGQFIPSRPPPVKAPKALTPKVNDFDPDEFLKSPDVEMPEIEMEPAPIKGRFDTVGGRDRWNEAAANQPYEPVDVFAGSEDKKKFDEGMARRQKEDEFEKLPPQEKAFRGAVEHVDKTWGPELSDSDINLQDKWKGKLTDPTFKKSWSGLEEDQKQEVIRRFAVNYLKAYGREDPYRLREVDDFYKTFKGSVNLVSDPDMGEMIKTDAAQALHTIKNSLLSMDYQVGGFIKDFLYDTVKGEKPVIKNIKDYTGHLSGLAEGQIRQMFDRYDQWANETGQSISMAGIGQNEKARAGKGLADGSMAMLTALLERPNKDPNLTINQLMKIDESMRTAARARYPNGTEADFNSGGRYSIFSPENNKLLEKYYETRDPKMLGAIAAKMNYSPNDQEQQKQIDRHAGAFEGGLYGREVVTQATDPLEAATNLVEIGLATSSGGLSLGARTLLEARLARRGLTMGADDYLKMVKALGPNGKKFEEVALGGRTGAARYLRAVEKLGTFGETFENATLFSATEGGQEFVQAAPMFDPNYSPSQQLNNTVMGLVVGSVMGGMTRLPKFALDKLDSIKNQAILDSINAKSKRGEEIKLSDFGELKQFITQEQLDRANALGSAEANAGADQKSSQATAEALPGEEIPPMTASEAEGQMIPLNFQGEPTTTVEALEAEIAGGAQARARGGEAAFLDDLGGEPVEAEQEQLPPEVMNAYATISELSEPRVEPNRANPNAPPVEIPMSDNQKAQLEEAQQVVADYEKGIQKGTNEQAKLQEEQAEQARLETGDLDDLEWGDYNAFIQDVVRDGKKWAAAGGKKDWMRKRALAGGDVQIDGGSPIVTENARQRLPEAFRGMPESQYRAQIRQSMPPPLPKQKPMPKQKPLGDMALAFEQQPKVERAPEPDVPPVAESGETMSREEFFGTLDRGGIRMDVGRRTLGKFLDVLQTAMPEKFGQLKVVIGDGKFIKAMGNKNPKLKSLSGAAAVVHRGTIYINRDVINRNKQLVTTALQLFEEVGHFVEDALPADAKAELAQAWKELTQAERDSVRFGYEVTWAVKAGEVPNLSDNAIRSEWFAQQIVKRIRDGSQMSHVLMNKSKLIRAIKEFFMRFQDLIRFAKNEEGYLRKEGLLYGDVKTDERIQEMLDRVLELKPLQSEQAKQAVKKTGAKKVYTPQELKAMTDAEVVEVLSENYLHQFPGAIAEDIQNEAKQMKADIEGGEAGKRIPKGEIDDPYSTNLPMVRGERGYEFAGVPSTYPEWYGKLKRPKESVMAALQRIIDDQGRDKGPFVERLKRIILERKFEGFIDKEVGPIPPDADFVRKLGRQISDGLKSEMDTEMEPAFAPGAPKDWQPFPESSKSLGMARKDMPQIKMPDRENFIEFIKGKGVQIVNTTVNPNELKPSQKEFSPEQAERAKGLPESRRLLVSKDNYLLDGHHQWLANKDKASINITKINLPVREALDLMKSYPRAKVSSGLEKLPAHAEMLRVFDKYRGMGTQDKKETDAQMLKRLTEENGAEKVGRAMQKYNAALPKYKAAKPDFDNKLKQIAAKFNAEAVIPPTLKSIGRTVEKTVVTNAGVFSRMKDILRGSIVVDSLADVEGVLNDVQSQFTIYGEIKNRFSPPLPNGYADVLLNVDLGNNVRAEIQIHIPEMIEAKEVAHPLYNDYRTIAENPKLKADPAKKAEADKIAAQMKEIYDSAAKAAIERFTNSSKAAGEISEAVSSFIELVSSKSLAEPVKKLSGLEPSVQATGTSSKSKNLVPSGSSELSVGSFIKKNIPSPAENVKQDEGLYAPGMAAEELPIVRKTTETQELRGQKAWISPEGRVITLGVFDAHEDYSRAQGGNDAMIRKGWLRWTGTHAAGETPYVQGAKPTRAQRQVLEDFHFDHPDMTINREGMSGETEALFEPEEVGARFAPGEALDEIPDADLKIEYDSIRNNVSKFNGLLRDGKRTLELYNKPRRLETDEEFTQRLQLETGFSTEDEADAAAIKAEELNRQIRASAERRRDGNAVKETPSEFGGVQKPQPTMESLRKLRAQQKFEGAKEAGKKGGDLTQDLFADQGQQELFTKNAVIHEEGLYAPAFHGTGHKVEGGFKTEKIGTGEGAQAYGWGLYFAENPKVAEEYRKKLSSPSMDDLRAYYQPGKVIKTGVGFYDRVISFNGNTRGAWSVTVHRVVKDKTTGEWKDAAYERTRTHSTWPDKREMDEQGIKPGNLYTVDIDDKAVETFIDWDKTLSEQSPEVRKILIKALDAVDKKARDRILKEPESASAAYIYAQIAMDVGGRLGEKFDGGATVPLYMQGVQVPNEQKASQFLASHGIKGIRFLDQFSRNNKDTLESYERELKKLEAKFADGVVYANGMNLEPRIFRLKELIDDLKLQMARDGAKKTRNYVVFDENDITITHENGQEVSMEEAMALAAPGEAVGQMDLFAEQAMKQENIPVTSTNVPEPSPVKPAEEAKIKAERATRKPLTKDETQLTLSYDLRRGKSVDQERLPRGVSQGSGSVRPETLPEVGRLPEVDESRRVGTVADDTGERSGTRDAARQVSPEDEARRKRANDLRYTVDKPVELTPRVRVESNIKAMKIVAKYREDRTYKATDAEKDALRQYTGWGGLANEFLDPRRGTATIERVKALVGEEGLSAARAGVTNAHYTSYRVVKFAWDLVEKLGFKGGRVLEPAVGTGNFIGLSPEVPTEFTGIELDPLVADISTLLFPDSRIINSGFEAIDGHNGFFDLAISNVPFGDYKPMLKMTDPYFKMKPLIHDYFMLRMLDKVQPGGLVVAVTGKGTMDKLNSQVRKMLAEKADLVAAFRLPDTAFKDNADTQVTTDLIILRKKGGKGVVTTENFETLDVDPASGLKVNEYFVRHPENMFGKMELGGMMSRSQAKLTGVAAAELPGYFQKALEKVKPVTMPESFGQSDEGQTGQVPADVDYQPGEIYVKDDKLFLVVSKGMAVQQSIVPTQMEQVRSAVAIKKVLRQLLNVQSETTSDMKLKGLQGELKKRVDDHIKKFGSRAERDGDFAKSPLLETRVLNQYMASDPDFYKITGLVDNKGRYSDIFTTRTVFSSGFKPVDPKPDAAMSDVAIYVRNQKGELDVAEVARIKKISEEAARKELLDSGLAYADPNKPSRVIHHIEYLSGDDVYSKLDEATAEAKRNPEFQRNVDALTGIIPELKSFEKLGGGINTRQRYYSTTAMEAYLNRLLDGNFTVKLYKTGKIEIKGRGKNDSEFGNQQGTYSEAFEAYANNEPIAIYGENVENPTAAQRQDILARKATQRAFEKKTSDDFAKWTQENGELPLNIEGKQTLLRDHFEKTYNRTFNRSVRPKYDGSTLKFDGLAGEMGGKPMSIHKHNLDFAARMLFEGRGGNAHDVGAGKTFAGALTVKAWKQAGVVKKPLIIVPKKVIGKWAREYAGLFPGDNILVIDEFDKPNRERLMSQIAISKPDAIFMTHDHFKMIPNDPALETEMVNDELQVLREQLIEIESDKNANKRTIRSIENSIKKLESKLNELSQFAKTKVINFKELGIDGLVLDEAHNFKNLPVQTKEQASGIPSGESQRAFDLYIKTRQVLNKNQNRGVLMLTATPVSNTMAEVYNMVKFVSPESWTSRGIRNFDQWMDQFGQIVSKAQLLVDGTFGTRKSLSSFRNLGELQKIFNQYWEYKTAEELGLKRPEANRITTVVEPSESQEHYFKDITVRANDIRNRAVTPDVDNMLKLSTDGRKAALDMRLIGANTYANFADYPGSKLNVVADDMAKRYHDGLKGQKPSGQLVFFDMYNMEALEEMAEAEAEETKDAEGEEIAPTESEIVPRKKKKKMADFSLHDELVKRLVERGVPAKEIAILNGKVNKSADQKNTVSTLYNEGYYRIVIGTTAAMGEGMNLQKITTAIHHLDVPLKPSHMIQRDGRGLRQGNVHPIIDIVRYTTRGSFDAYLYQTLARKAGFIEDFSSGRDIGDSADEVTDSMALDYESVMGETNSDPRVREYFVTQLKRNEALVSLNGAQSEQRANKAKVEKLTRMIATGESDVTELDKQITERNSKFKKLLGDKFDEKALPDKLPLELTVSGAEFADEKDIQERLNKYMATNEKGWIIPSPSFPKGGFELNGIKYDTEIVDENPLAGVSSDVTVVRQAGGDNYMVVAEGKTPGGFVTGRLRYDLRSLDGRLVKVKDFLASNKDQKAAAERREASGVGMVNGALQTWRELNAQVETLGKAIGAIPKTEAEILAEQQKESGAALAAPGEAMYAPGEAKGRFKTFFTRFFTTTRGLTEEQFKSAARSAAAIERAKGETTLKARHAVDLFNAIPRKSQAQALEQLNRIINKDVTLEDIERLKTALGEEVGNKVLETYKFIRKETDELSGELLRTMATRTGETAELKETLDNLFGDRVVWDETTDEEIKNAMEAFKKGQETPLEKKIRANIGKYMLRTYAMYLDPNYQATEEAKAGAMQSIASALVRKAEELLGFVNDRLVKDYGQMDVEAAVSNRRSIAQEQGEAWHPGREKKARDKYRQINELREKARQILTDAVNGDRSLADVVNSQVMALDIETENTAEAREALNELKKEYAERVVSAVKRIRGLKKLLELQTGRALEIGANGSAALNLSAEDIDSLSEGVMRQLLTKPTERGIAPPSPTSQHRQDRASFLKRKQIGEAIRLLKGEVKNPLVRFELAAGRISKSIAQHKYWNGVREFQFSLDLNDPTRWLFEQSRGKASVMLSDESLGPINGLYTTQEVADEVLGANEIINSGWDSFGSTLKAMMTVYNIPTHFGNILGNQFFIAADSPGVMKSIPAALKEMANKGPLYLKAIELGILGNEVSAREITQKAIAGKVLTNFDALEASVNPMDKLKLALKKGAGVLPWLYQAEDQAVKLAAFIEHRKTMSDTKAADRVGLYYPDYNRVPLAFQWSRKLPVGQNFISFAFENVRIAVNHVTQAGVELSKAETRKSGVLHAARIAVVGAFPFAVKWAMMGLLGGDDEEKKRRQYDALQQMMPSYERAGLLVPFFNKDGKIEKMWNLGVIYPWQDISSIPYSIAKAIKGDLSWRYVGHQMANIGIETQFSYDLIISVVLNRDLQTGRPITTRENPLLHSTERLLRPLWEYMPMAPRIEALGLDKAGKTIEPFYQAFKGEADRYGRERTLPGSAANFFRVRVTDMNYPATVSSYLKTIASNWTETNRDLSYTGPSKQGRPGVNDTAHQRAQADRQAVWNQALRGVELARDVGMSDEDLHQILGPSSRGGVQFGSQELISALLRGSANPPDWRERTSRPLLLEKKE